MTTDNKTYFRLSALVISTENVTDVVLEDMDGSKVRPQTQQAIGRLLQEQAEQLEYVYIAKTYKPEQRGYKVGRTKDLTRRERELGLQIALAIPCDVWHDFSASYLESFLHELYDLAGLRITREWFNLNWWDIELVRVCFQEAVSFAEKKYSFVELYRSLGGIRDIVTKPVNSNTKQLLQAMVKVWNNHEDLAARISITYLLRYLAITEYVPLSLFRYAIENTIFLEQQADGNKHIRPLEKTFEEAVVEYLKSQLATP